MRNIISFTHISLDGFIAGLNGEMDWMVWDWDEELKQYVKKLKRFLAAHNLIPSYQEESPFLILVSIAAIAAVDPSLRATAYDLLVHSPKAEAYAGMIYIIYTTFFSYFRTIRQKSSIFYFIMLTNVLSIFAVGSHLMHDGGNILSYGVFLLSALILLGTIVLWTAGELDSETISSRSAEYSPVLYGSFIVIFLVIITKFGLGFKWPTIFSLSVSYAILFNKNVIAYMPKIPSSRTADMDAIERIMNASIAALANEPETPEEDFCMIVSQHGYRKAVYSKQDLAYPERFYARELARENRTDRFVAISTRSEYEYRPFFLRSKRVRDVYAVNIYPNDRRRGWQFIRFVDTGLDDNLDNKTVYLQRIENLFVSK